MFTGLIEKTAKVLDFSLSSKGGVLCVENVFDDDLKIGDSIATNGCCLTLTKKTTSELFFDVMIESLSISNLKNLKKGDIVNLERAMKLTDRLDGHIVTGHIDTISKLKKITQDGFSKRLEFSCDTSLIVQKGSITINGVSLTVSKLFEDGFEVSLIPETKTKTNLDNLKIGDIVNIEYDILAKYIQRMFKNNKEKKEITLEFLKENGF